MDILRRASGGNRSVIWTFLSHVFNEQRDKILRSHVQMTKKPWMKYREIEIIKEIIMRLCPRRCLEWGTGYSTLFFPDLIDTTSIWTSIEHNKKWAGKIRNMNSRPNVEIHYIPANRRPWRDAYGDGTYHEFKNYVDFPSGMEYFDLILVDGRAREPCLYKAHELIGEQGVVILHDANREKYHAPFDRFPDHLLFRDYREDVGGLWLGSKGGEIGGVLNVTRQVELWKLYNVLGTMVKM